MKREIFTTADGSTSLHIPEWDEQYHSKHGAVQEAMHVFIKMGLHAYMQLHQPSEIAVLEIGFGTGLNAFLTFLESTTKNVVVNYTGIEAYPLSAALANQMNYTTILNAENYAHVFQKFHEISWEQPSQLTPNFKLQKRKMLFNQLIDINNYDLIYFDAFGSRVQPDLWEVEIFEIMYKAMRPNGILVTYAAKGSARRALQEVGFTTERLQGPPGKREMLRATKLA